VRNDRHVKRKKERKHMLKPSTLHSTCQFPETNEAVFEASYHFALGFSECKERHTIGGDQVKNVSA
jgi:hypothetical protein